ncbi:hypothetical protein JTB14_014086 [Gonioctena quinquepunctata]|nr:hypothetical protein JTB14_014086 [Gonioctena quinquepunctata]
MDYGFHDQLIWATIGGLTLTFVFHWPIIHFFRFPYQGKNYERNGRDIGGYPFSDVLCWCLLVFLLLISMTVLLVLGFWVPHVTVSLWMTSAMASLFIHVILLENVVRLVYNFTTGRTRRIRQIFPRIKPVLAYIEAQKNYVREKYGIDSLRSYHEHIYRPLNQYEVKVRKYWEKIRREFLGIIQDLIMILIYVVLLYTAILNNSDSMERMSNQEVTDLLSGIYTGRMNPEQESFNEKELENYIKNTIIFSMQSLQWYGIYFNRDPGMTIDNNNKYIGIARLRQQRSNNNSCVVYPSMKFVTDHCITPFADGPEFRDFSEAWGNNSESDEFARMDSVWKYHTKQMIGIPNYMGEFATYSDDGYVATLGRTWKNSLININYLYRNNWIDRYTRSLFVEFLMYSPNTNLFQSVRVAFELGTTGLILGKFSIRTARFLFVKNESNVPFLVVIVLLLSMVVVLLLNFLLKMVQNKKLVFKDVWNLADIIIISLSVTCSFLYLQKSFLTKIFLDRVGNAKHNEFINYFHLFFSETLLYSLSASLVFIATLRLWKLLRFLLIIRITEKTLRLSVFRLFFVLIWQIVVVLVFQLVGLMIYGDQYEFRDNQHSMMTLILLALLFIKTYDFELVRTTTQRSYFFFYLIISFFFFTINLTVITTCYIEARTYYSNREEYNVINYLYEQYQYYKGVIVIKRKGCRRRAGKDGSTFMENKLVFAKANEYRYAKCLKIPRSKMNTLSYITRGILRNMKYSSDFTEEDGNLMKMIITEMIIPDTKDEEYFFVGNSGNKKEILVDDLVFKRMEKLLISLLDRREGREKIDNAIFGSIENNLSDVSKLLVSVDFMLNSL